MAAKWDPSPEWEGEDAYVVGGGPSLRHFDWDLLRGKNTIGCNSAFILGVDVVKITIFADYLWWKQIGESGTAAYGGRVVSACPRLRRYPCPWLLHMDRYDTAGLDTRTLGFNGHTGSMALNLALILGARRVFLLGYDMRVEAPCACKACQEAGERAKFQANWHDVRRNQGVPSVYGNFIQGLGHVARDLPIKFPGREVLNVTDGSALDHFPKLPVAYVFGQHPYRKEGVTYALCSDVPHGRACDPGPLSTPPVHHLHGGSADPAARLGLQVVADGQDAE